MKLIKKILETELLQSDPPVLLDIGASGEIHKKWEPIAAYSICIAFDADNREFAVEENASSRFRKLVTVNRIVSSEMKEKTNFYLTRSPYCSSMLPPNQKKLSPYMFAQLFQVVDQVELQTIQLNSFLESIGIAYIDWFKSDTQGTDLRLLQSLSDKLTDSLLCIEMEPGIMDAYIGEDKLGAVLTELDKMPFWLSTMNIMGNHRVPGDIARNISSYHRNKMIRFSPGWAELSFLREPEKLNSRGTLLLIVFAIIEKQYGFALEAALYGQRHHADAIFGEAIHDLQKKIKTEAAKSPLVSLKRFLNKNLRSIND